MITSRYVGGTASFATHHDGCREGGSVKIAADRIVLETTENNIEKFSTVYLVVEGETVQHLMERLDIKGNRNSDFDMVEVRLKLIKGES